MKHAIIIALALCVLAVAAPVGAMTFPSTMQIASGSMTGVSNSIQVSGNVNYDGHSVMQYSEAKMKFVGSSIQVVGNVNWKGNHVEQQATGRMKCTFKSIQVVPNVNIG